MQKTGTKKHCCRICGKRLLGKDLRDYSWVCTECNKRQLQTRGLVSANEERKKYREEQRFLLRGQLEDKGFLTIDKAAKTSSMSRRTVFNRIKSHGNLIDTTKSGNQTRVNIKKLSRLNDDLRKRSDWALKISPLMRKGLKSATEVFNFTEVISLEEAIKVTGLTRRYFRRLIGEGKIQTLEPLRLTPLEKNPLRDLKPIEIKQIKAGQDSLGYLSYYRKFKQHSPVVFLEKNAVLHRTWLQKPYRTQSRPTRHTVSQKDIERLATLLPLLPEEIKLKLNVFPEEYRLVAVEDYLESAKR